MNVINLKQTGSGWQFEGEDALEDFVWSNLPQLFGFEKMDFKDKINKKKTLKTMNLQQLKNEAYKLSVSDRLALVEVLVNSVMDELEPPRQVPEGVLERLRGCLKTEAPPPTDEEVEAMLQQRREEKYL